jgi:hypothetical protein
MNRFRVAASRVCDSKPIHLVVTAIIWAFSIAISVIYLTVHWLTVPHPLIAFALVPLFGAGVLWFYWKGYSWTRYLMLLTSVLNAIDALYSLTGLQVLTYLGSQVDGGKFPNVCRLCVSTYFIVWLISSEASKYFSTEARHARQSLATYEALRRRCS